MPEYIHVFSLFVEIGGSGLKAEREVPALALDRIGCCFSVNVLGFRFNGLCLCFFPLYEPDMLGVSCFPKTRFKFRNTENEEEKHRSPGKKDIDRICSGNVDLSKKEKLIGQIFKFRDV